MSGNNGRGQTEKRRNVETSKRPDGETVKSPNVETSMGKTAKSPNVETAKPEAPGEDCSPIEVAKAALKECLLTTAQRCAADETRVRKPMAWMVVIGADELATVQDLWAAIQMDQPEKVAGVEMDIAPDQRAGGGRMVVLFAKSSWGEGTEKP